MDFFGQWSDGQYADGNVELMQNPNNLASLYEQIAPEPSSFMLLGTGIVALWRWRKELMP